jgi:hypothetical protein
MDLKTYFDQNRYKSKYLIGDRIEGKYNKIPFVGSVGNDSVRNDDEAPHVTVHLDLPLAINGKIYYILRVPTDSVKVRK